MTKTNTPTIGRVEGYVTDNEFMSSYTSDKFESMKAVKDLERVVETAVERNSWGKSRGGRMCRFPNTGGLHHTSGNAPLDTRIMSHNENRLGTHTGTKSSSATSMIAPGTTVPPIIHDFDLTTHSPWCHVYKSQTPSSKRTRVAASAFKDQSHKLASRTTKRTRYSNADRKNYKQVRFLKEVQVCNIASTNNVKYLTADNIKHHIVVCDGGDTIDDAIQPDITRSDVQVLRIRNGDLWVADTGNATLGLRFTSPSDKMPTFIRLPRNDSLGIMNHGRSVCRAIRTCASTQRQSLARGKGNHVFTENNSKYCCVGAQPGRAQKGVLSGLYRLKHGFESKDWDTLHKLLKRAEYAFDRYMNTDIIRHISCARSRVNFKTMEPSPSSSHQKTGRYYSGLGFGINVFLRCHVDRDFTMSIVQVHVDDHIYQVDDKILCYFAFPRIGIAVALRPGDFLLFNPQEPHSISSRCRTEDEIYCISSYLKTAVVGLNDNSNSIV